MPCEACNIQFTVFKRKKSCTECRRLYCSNCLTKTKERILCKRCVVFTTRPLSKIELLKLKAKDLIFYLQSKHISTTGCVEKEELVNLVLIHVDNSTNFSPDSQSSPTSFSMGTDQSDDARSNPFDHIRNTCQNLFSTFTEKIAADFNFDFKQNQSDQRQSNVCEDQPRHSNSFRNVPSFNSMNGSSGGGGQPPPPPPTSTMTSSQINHHQQQSATAAAANAQHMKSPTSPPPSSNGSKAATAVRGPNQKSTSNSQMSSATTINASQHLPSTAIMKSSNQSTTTTTIQRRPSSNGQHQPIPSTSTRKSSGSGGRAVNTKITELSRIDCCNDSGSGCECSDADDELISKFRERYGDQPLSPTTETVPTAAAVMAVVDQTATSSSSDVNANGSTATITTVATIQSMASTSTSSSTATSATTTAGSTGTGTGTTKTGNNTLDTPSKDDAAFESSDISSFEDLGAVGGLQTVTSLPSTSDTDKWQIINPNSWNIDDTASSSSIVDNITTTSGDNERNNHADSAHNISYTTNLPNSITDELPQTNLSENQRHEQQQQQRQQQQSQIDASDRDTFPVHSTSEQQLDQQQHAERTGQQQQQQPNRPTDLRSKLEKTFKAQQAHRKITRRQSDGIVYSASTSNGTSDTSNGRSLNDLEDGDGGGVGGSSSVDDGGSSTSEDISSSHKRTPNKPCRKCGKTKGNLKKYIARFRNQLETTTAFSETEIKLQLAAFLEFLENHSAFDSKDEESVPNTELEQSPSQFVELEVFDDDDDDDDDDGGDEFDDDTGIHVYGSNDDTNTSSHPPRQFFDLNSVERKEELDELTVKQLKEVLMLNRVDFKGCCEKSELLERVQRLWDDLQNCPAVDKLATVDLCKICMDAAIECVLLECGHMATCTNCGKVLSECPICRQYIVRVVRFFKA